VLGSTGAVDDELIERLTGLGLRKNEAMAYLALVRHGVATAAEIADSAKVSRPKVYEALKGLEHEGFCVVTTTSNVSRYQPVEPALALGELKQRREHARELARRQDEDLAGDIIANLPFSDESSAPLADGYMLARVDEQLTMFTELATRAQRQLDIVLGSPQVTPPDIGLQPEIDALERGVKLRVIYNTDALAHEDAFSTLAAAGAETRWLADIPLRLALRDSGTEGLVSLVAPTEAGMVSMSVGIRHRELATPFQALFNRQWRQAAPVAVDGRHASGQRRRT
jgi:sugar-specific transcriptional regulator TrmB